MQARIENVTTFTHRACKEAAALYRQGAKLVRLTAYSGDFIVNVMELDNRALLKSGRVSAYMTRLISELPATCNRLEVSVPDSETFTSLVLNKQSA